MMWAASCSKKGPSLISGRSQQPPNPDVGVSLIFSEPLLRLVTVFDIFHVTRLYQCSTHVSQPHSQTRDIHTYTLTSFSEISKKSDHVSVRGLSRPHSPVPQTMYWGQIEISKWRANCLPFQPRRPRRHVAQVTGPFFLVSPPGGPCC